MSPALFTSPLPELELEQLEQLIAQAGEQIRSQVLTTVFHNNRPLPIYACSLGSEAPNVPVLALIGGIHGVERIGSQVVLAFLETLVQRLNWDESLILGLQNLRLLFIPIANPIGVIMQTRANGNGVDLMRNAPIEATNPSLCLVAGHRLSNKLPWYRGAKDGSLEMEAEAISNAIDNELKKSPFTLLLDVHSGYGFKDRLWFPLASSHNPVQNLPDIYSLYQLLEKTYPNLNYVFEPQSKNYLTHGDLWDFVYLNHQNKSPAKPFLPLTLEMGSWNWVKKNPGQLLSFSGLFNPVKYHRTQRVLRRHTILLEFLIRATRAYANWLPQEEQREQVKYKALKHWYQQEFKNQ